PGVQAEAVQRAGIERHQRGLADSGRRLQERDRSRTARLAGEPDARADRAAADQRDTNATGVQRRELAGDAGDAPGVEPAVLACEQGGPDLHHDTAYAFE